MRMSVGHSLFCKEKFVGKNLSSTHNYYYSKDFNNNKLSRQTEVDLFELGIYLLFFLFIESCILWKNGEKC